MATKGKRKRQQEPGLDLSEGEHSSLWLLLMQKFSLGKLSASEVQRFAEAAIKSGCTAPDLESLAAIGAHGNSKQNCHRDLVKKYFQNLVTPTTSTTKCTLQSRNADGELAATTVEVPVLLPHEWVRSLEKQDLLEEITAHSDAIRTFWQQQADLGLLDSPFWNSFDWESELPIPWNLHGDGAPYSEVDSIKVISMRCPLSKLQVEQSQLLLAALPKKLDLFFWLGLESPEKQTG